MKKIIIALAAASALLGAPAMAANSDTDIQIIQKWKAAMNSCEGKGPS